MDILVPLIFLIRPKLTSRMRRLRRVNSPGPMNLFVRIRQLKLKICTNPIRRLAVVFVFAVVRQRLDGVKRCEMYSVDVDIVKNKVCA